MPINLEIQNSFAPDHYREGTQLLGGLNDSMSDQRQSKQSNRNVIRVNNKIGAATIQKKPEANNDGLNFSSIERVADLIAGKSTNLMPNLQPNKDLSGQGQSLNDLIK